MMVTASWWVVARVADSSQPFSFEPWAALFVLVPAIMLPGCLRMIRLAPQSPLPAAAAMAAIVVLILPGGLHVESAIPPLDTLLVQPRLRVPLDANSPAVDWSTARHRGPCVRSVNDWVMSSGSQAMYELEGLNGPDALQLANYEELFKAQRPESGADGVGSPECQWQTFHAWRHFSTCSTPGFCSPDLTRFPIGFSDVSVMGADLSRPGVAPAPGRAPSSPTASPHTRTRPTYSAE